MSQLTEAFDGDGNADPDIARLIDAAETVYVQRPNTVLRIAPPTQLPQSGIGKNAVQEGRL